MSDDVGWQALGTVETIDASETSEVVETGESDAEAPYRLHGKIILNGKGAVGFRASLNGPVSRDAALYDWDSRRCILVDGAYQVGTRQVFDVRLSITGYVERSEVQSSPNMSKEELREAFKEATRRAELGPSAEDRPINLRIIMKCFLSEGVQYFSANIDTGTVIVHRPNLGRDRADSIIQDLVNSGTLTEARAIKERSAWPSNIALYWTNGVYEIIAGGELAADGETLIFRHAPAESGLRLVLRHAGAASATGDCGAFPVLLDEPFPLEQGQELIIDL